MLPWLWGAASRAGPAEWLLPGALLLLLALWLLGAWGGSYGAFRRRGLPSSRPAWPFLGDAGPAFLGLRPLPDTVSEIYRRGAGHSVYGFFQFRTPLLMLRDPEVIRAAAVKQFDHFMNHREIVSQEADPIFAKNLMMLKGERWRSTRKTLSPAFTSSKIKGTFPLIRQCCEQMVDHLRQRFVPESGGARVQRVEVDMKDMFSRLANDAIATAAFGLSCNSLQEPENTFHRMGKALTSVGLLRLLRFTGWVIVPALMKRLRVRALDPRAVAFFSALVRATVRERQQRGVARPDVLQLLMQANEGRLRVDAEDAHEAEHIDAACRRLTEEDIIAQAVIFFFAGFETVSTALCFCSLTISRHPDVQKRLQQEIDEALEGADGELTYEAVQGMRYLDMVISETLRLHPALSATDRVCVHAATLPAAAAGEGPVRVRRGDLLLVPIYALHRDPKYWEEPEKFDPERFSDENKHKITPFTYMPFGVGPRICIGQRLALLEVKLALVNLLSNFHLLPSEKTVTPIRYENGLNMMVKGGFWCEVVPRKH